MVYRIYVSKRNEYAVEAHELLNNLTTQLKIENLTSLIVYHRYDIQGVSEQILNSGVNIILSEPMVDDVFYESINFEDKKVFAI